MDPFYGAAMDTSAEYVVVSASLREASLSRALANELLAYYRESKLNSQLLDLRQVELPFCDADAAYGHPQRGGLAEPVELGTGDYRRNANL